MPLPDFDHDPSRPVVKADPELERLLKEEEEIEALVRKNQIVTFSHAQEEKHSLLSHLAWLSGEAVMKEDAEALLAIATVVKFARGLT